MALKSTALIMLAGLLLTATLTTRVFAADATFSWLPNTETDLAGYNIHYGPATGEYATVIDVGLPELVDGRVQYTLTGVPDGLIFYAATAYDTERNESGYSTEVLYNPAPTAPQDLFSITVNVEVIVNQ